MTGADTLTASSLTFFLASGLAGAAFGAGAESLEVKMVAEHEIPWDEIAFTSTTYTLKRFLEDRAAGAERHHFTEIDRRAYA